MELFTVTLLLIIFFEITFVLLKTNRVSHSSGSKPIFVDTSVLIDGRIVAVAQTGFIAGNLCIPRSVLGELQLLADSADAEKRSRARHGLDVANELQKIPGLQIKIFADKPQANEGVDQRLLKLAEKYNGSICTIDYNLNKVAQVEGINVLNINDLALSLRMAYLPGEKIVIELTQKGQDNHQAIGHLPDGTMVVVEKASDKIGQIVEVEFIRSLQTAAGKMMFARLAGNSSRPVNKQSNSTNDRPNNYRNRSKKYDDRKTDKPTRDRQPARKNSEQNIIDLVNNQ